ncbi:MAG: hypothetical protein ABL912_03720 [Novosphingobium sp.]
MTAHPEPVEPQATGGQRRELPDFLKRGDADLGAPRARYPGMQIGKGVMRREGAPEPCGGDALSARECQAMVKLME